MMPVDLRCAAQVAVLLALAALPLALPVCGQQAAFDPDLLAGLRARSIGPAVTSGRVTAVEGVAADPRTIYAGAAAGGVWKSVNGGQGWEPIFDDQPVASIGAIAVFQKSPEIVWVGTGEGNPRNSVSAGNGVYRSLDGGKTWTHLGLDATERISRIVLHPTDPDVAWVAALGRAWGENPERGVFLTEDGGKSWKKVLYVDQRTGAADLAVDPGNPRKLLAAMWQYRRWPWRFESGGAGSGLYASLDGGHTWKRRTEDDGLPKGQLGRINLAFSRSNPEVVYASVEATKSALLRSSDGGRSWVKVNETPQITPRPFYFAELKVDPQWPNRVYSLGFFIRVSEDSGKTFANLPACNKLHTDYHTLWIDPGDPRHFVSGSDGGLAISHDRGQTAAFVANLPLAQYYHVAVDDERPYNVYGGLQDNSSWRGPSATWEAGGIPNSAWALVGFGDGFGTLPDPQDASTGWSMSQDGYLTRWDLKTGEIKDARPAAPEGGRLRFNWNPGIALDPFAPGTIYYGSQYLHKSTDRGRTWTTISPDLTTNYPAWQQESDSGGITPDLSGAEATTTITAIAPSPVAPGVIWVGTADGRVQLTRDGGKSWTSVEAKVPGVPANTWVPEIRASRFEAGGAFVLFDDHRRSNWTPYVYRTDDFGKTWKGLAGAAVRGWALTIEQDPTDKDLLFLGTEMGLWISGDGGRRWLRYKHGLPTAPVAGLAIQPRERDLVIATHGRALYVLDDIRPLAGLSAAVLGEPLHLFPVAAAQQHWRRLTFGVNGTSDFSGQNRPYGALITFSASGPDLPLPDPERERARKERERAAAATAAAAARAKRVKGEETPPPLAPAAPAVPAAPVPPAPPEPTASPAPAAGERAAAESKPRPEERTAAATAAGTAAGTPAAEAGKAGTGKDDKKKAEPPKAQIEVADASGRAIRHFKTPVQLGINRVAWGLERDDWKEPGPPPPDQPTEEDPPGPEVPPGTYTVTVRFRGHEARTTVEVLADPRSANDAPDWQRRWAAVTRAGALQQAVSEAIERIARLRADVDAAVAKDKQAAEQAAERSGKPKPDADAPPSPLAAAAEKLGKRLDELEKRLWVRPDAKGLTGIEDLADQVLLVSQAITGQWDPPTPTQLETLRQLGEKVERFLAELNRFYAGDVTAFRKQVADARIALLAEEPPLTVGTGQ
jgi:photosystem II stability/assembly factor-like uncharacterized protein